MENNIKERSAWLILLQALQNAKPIVEQHQDVVVHKQAASAK